MKIIDEIREIKAIEIADICSWTVGKNGVIQITPYYENGEMAATVWFKIIVDGQVLYRVNGKQVTIVSYEKQKVV